VTGLVVRRPPPARVEARIGRRWCVCPACGRKLGEVVSGRLVIRYGGLTIAALGVREPALLTCPRCLIESELRPDAVGGEENGRWTANA
jgi:hypothetical protein